MVVITVEGPMDWRLLVLLDTTLVGGCTMIEVPGVILFAIEGFVGSSVGFPAAESGS